jgi:hypothetical protein
MLRASSCLWLVMLTAVLGLGTAGSGQAAGWLEKSFFLFGPRYDNAVPGCEAGLDTIASEFAQKESRFWNSSLQIVSFERVREVARNAWAHGTIPRRFCRAVALVSDQRKHAVYYWIGEDTGFVGATWGVRWCVVGLDRNWAYNPACKMARP